MRHVKLKKIIAAFVIIGLVGTTPFTYALETNTIEDSQIQDSVWKVTVEMGESIPVSQIKQSIEHKYSMILDDQDEVKVTWTKGKELFEEGIAIKQGKAFIKLKIKEIDEKGNCRILGQCIEMTIPEKVEPISHIPYIKGYEDGTFRPERGITREELATMVGRLMLGAQKPIYQENFEDVSDTRYSAAYVGYVTEMGIMHSYEDGTFRPTDMVSKQEFMQVVKRINKLKGKQISVDHLSMQNITRVESVFLLNQLFERVCDDVMIDNLYSDIDSNTLGYDDILYASIYHTHK